MNRNNLLLLISDEKWSRLVKEFSLDDICYLLNYKECMALAYDLFFKNFINDEIQSFAVQLFFSTKNKYQSDWSTDWKNDVFLGKLCSITWKYNEMYACYKEAYNNLVDPPDSLLLLLASCNSTPGNPLVTDQESEKYVERAIAKKLTYEAALMMREFAKSKEANDKVEYWNRTCIELEKNHVHTETIVPDILASQNRR